MKGRTDGNCNPTFLVKCFTDKKSISYVRLQFYTVENAVAVKAMDVLITALMVVTVKSEDVIRRKRGYILVLNLPPAREASFHTDIESKVIGLQLEVTLTDQSPLRGNLAWFADNLCHAAFKECVTVWGSVELPVSCHHSPGLFLAEMLKIDTDVSVTESEFFLELLDELREKDALERSLYILVGNGQTHILLSLEDVTYHCPLVCVLGDDGLEEGLCGDVLMKEHVENDVVPGLTACSVSGKRLVKNH